MQIRIYQDGTFESLSAVDTKAELAALKADMKIITKVEGLRVKREAAKKAGNKEKDKAFLAEIKKLKATLSSNRNSSVAVVREKIAKLSKAAIAPKLTRGNKTGDPRRNPVRKKALRGPGGIKPPKPSRPKEELYDDMDQKTLAAQIKKLEKKESTLEASMGRYDIIAHSPDVSEARKSKAREQVKALGKELYTVQSELEEARMRTSSGDDDDEGPGGRARIDRRVAKAPARRK